MAEQTPGRHDFTQPSPNFRTIKDSFKSIVGDPELIDKIREVVVRTNKIVADAYLFMKLYFMRKFNENKAFPVPYLDKTFVNYVIKVMGCTKRKSRGVKNKVLFLELKKFYTEQYQPLYKHRENNCTNLLPVLNYAVDDMIISIENNIKEHYIVRLKKYLRIFGARILKKNNVPEDQHRKILNNLVFSILRNKYKEIDPMFDKWFYSDVFGVVVPKTFYPLDEGEEPKEFPIAYECKKYPQLYLNHTFAIHDQYEFYNDRVEAKIKKNKDDSVYQDFIRVRKELDKLKKAKKKDQRAIREKREEKESLEVESKIAKLEAKKLKLFNCLPRSGFGITYVKFDTDAIMHLFYKQDKNDKNSPTKTNLHHNVKKYKEYVWKLLFKMDNRNLGRIGNYDFNYMIVTDGVGCSLSQRRKDCNSRWEGGNDRLEKYEFPYLRDLPKEQVLEYKNKMYIDPGKDCPIYGFDEFEDDFGEYNKYRYSTRQRQHEIGETRREEIMKKEKPKRIFQIEDELSKLHNKTVHEEKFIEYLKVYGKYEAELREFYQRELWQKWRWRKCINKRKFEDRLLNNMAEKAGPNTLVIIGNWSKSNVLKNGQPSLGIGTRRLLARKFPVTLLHEYNTSKKCCRCHQDTEPVYLDGRKIHRLLQCTNCSKKIAEQSETVSNSAFSNGMYIQRDTNSCRNMKTIVKHMLKKGMKTRPKAFVISSQFSESKTISNCVNKDV